MRNIFIAVCLCGLSYNLFSQQIASMKELTPDTGWVVTDKNIFWTTNGGANWKDIRPPQAGEISTVFFLDTMKGFVIVSQYNDQPISDDDTRDTNDFWLCTTEDAGLSWSSHRIPLRTLPGVGINGIEFAKFLEPDMVTRTPECAREPPRTHLYKIEQI